MNSEELNIDPRVYALLGITSITFGTVVGNNYKNYCKQKSLYIQDNQNGQDYVLEQKNHNFLGMQDIENKQDYFSQYKPQLNLEKVLFFENYQNEQCFEKSLFYFL